MAGQDVRGLAGPRRVIRHRDDDAIARNEGEVFLQVTVLDAEEHREGADRLVFIGPTHVDQQYALGPGQQCIELRTREHRRLRGIRGGCILRGPGPGSGFGGRDLRGEAPGDQCSDDQPAQRIYDVHG